MNQNMSGTKEWAAVNANCVDGCSHNCRYCYARYNAAIRFKKMPLEAWPQMKVNWIEVHKRRKKYNGRVMFPTQHDITPEVLDPCLTTIDNILLPGNDLLIVSKPHFKCIKAICDKFTQYKEKIMFRFTIGSLKDRDLLFWEPGAPFFSERMNCLTYAHHQGFKTSVSMEPLLTTPSYAKDMINKLYPYITDSIWIGKLNRPFERVMGADDWDPEDRQRMMELVKMQNDDQVIHALYRDLEGWEKIRWKESIKKVVGLPLSTIPGEDK